MKPGPDENMSGLAYGAKGGMVMLLQGGYKQGEGSVISQDQPGFHGFQYNNGKREGLYSRIMS